MRRNSIGKFWLVCLSCAALVCLINSIKANAASITTYSPVGNGEQAKALLAAGEETHQETILDDVKKIPLLNRFRLPDGGIGGGGFDEEERRSIYYGYKQGRVGEDDYSRFYSSTERPQPDNSWRKISFAIYEKPEKKLRLDVRPKDQMIMLRYTVRTAVPKP